VVEDQIWYRRLLQIGERELPDLALPVDFCFHGFLPPPLTIPRVLVAWVPLPLIGKGMQTIAL